METTRDAKDVVKLCKRCNERKTLDQFTKRSDRRSGLGSRCLACERVRNTARRSHPDAKAKARYYEKEYRLTHLPQELERERARGKRRRSDPKLYRVLIDSLKRNVVWLAALKDGPCVDCGGNFVRCAMDFDHNLGSKFKNVSAMLSYSQERIMAEIQKCDLVCANCHRVRTASRRAIPESRPGRDRFVERVNALKHRPCSDCSGRFPPCAMDYDHVRGEKLQGISYMFESAWSKVLIELAKCELVCANCHRTRTWQRKQVTAKRAA
jgi:hypothetical protein